MLDSVLTGMEGAAASLKADMQGLPRGLIDDYRERATASLDNLVKVLERVLESMGSGRGDGKHGIEAELFVGRVALYLGRSSSFLRDVVGEADVDTGKSSRKLVSNAHLSIAGCTAALLRVHTSSTIKWQQRTIMEAITKLAPLFEPHRGSYEVQATWQGRRSILRQAATANESLRSASDPTFLVHHGLSSLARRLGPPSRNTSRYQLTGRLRPGQSFRGRCSGS